MNSPERHLCFVLCLAGERSRGTGTGGAAAAAVNIFLFREATQADLVHQVIWNRPTPYLFSPDDLICGGDSRGNSFTWWVGLGRSRPSLWPKETRVTPEDERNSRDPQGVSGSLDQAARIGEVLV
jgi:hypothetical protein